MRKTREQVWRALDVMGESEVRERLAMRSPPALRPPQVQAWLDRHRRIASALAETSSAIAARDDRSSHPRRRHAAVIFLLSVSMAVLLILTATW